MKRILFIALLLLGAASVANAADVEDIKTMPGYVDLERIAVPDEAEELALIDLTPSLLQLAASSSEDDPELAKALAMVRSLRVKSFSLDDEYAKQLRPVIEEIEAELERDDWNRIIFVRDGDEMFSVSTKEHGDKIAGVMVMAFEPGDEAAFVNIIGEIDLASLLHLALGMENGDLEDLIEELKDR